MSQELCAHKHNADRAEETGYGDKQVTTKERKFAIWRIM